MPWSRGRASRLRHRGWSRACSCCHPAQRDRRLDGLVAVRERPRLVAYDLAAFMPLASDDENIALFQRGDTGMNGFGAITDLGCARRRRENLAANLRRVFAARIVVRDNHIVCEFRGGRAHQRTLALVAVAAAAEHDVKPVRDMRTDRA